jgi:hypothetical protein
MELRPRNASAISVLVLEAGGRERPAGIARQAEYRNCYEAFSGFGVCVFTFGARYVGAFDFGV